jgi:hypothetical protein
VHSKTRRRSHAALASVRRSLFSDFSNPIKAWANSFASYDPAALSPSIACESNLKSGAAFRFPDLRLDVEGELPTARAL